MAKDNESIEIKVEVDTSDVKKSMQDVSKETDKMAKNIKKSGDKAEDSFDGLTKGLKTIDKQMKNMFKNMNMNGFTSSINKAMKQAKQTVSNTAKSMTKVLDNVFGKKRTMELSAKTTTDASGGVSNATALAGSILTSGAMGSQTAKQMALIKDSVDNMVKTTSSAFKGLSTETQDKISKAVTISIAKIEELKEVTSSIEGIEFDPKGTLLGVIESGKEELEILDEAIEECESDLEALNQIKVDNQGVISPEAEKRLIEHIAYIKNAKTQHEQLSAKVKETQDAYQTFITLSDLKPQVEEINRLAQQWEDFRDSADAEALINALRTYKEALVQAGIAVGDIDDAIKHYETSIEKTGKVQNSTNKEMQKAVQYVNQVDSAFDDYTRTLDEQRDKQNAFTSSILKMRKAMPGLASIYDKTTASVKKMAEEHKKAGKEITNTAKKSENVLKSLGKQLAPYIGLAAVFSGLKKSITSYTDSLQDSSKFSLVFGNEAQNMTDWLNGFNSTVTTSKSTLMDLSTNLYRMGINMDMTTQDAMNMSKEMTELGAHLASFTGDANSIEALASALRGEYDSLQNFGYALDADTVKTQALKMGLDASTESAKVMARQFLILDQSDDVLAFAAKNANSLSTQIAILQKNFQALGTAIGSCFAGLLQVVLPVLNSVVSAVTNAFNKIAKVLNDIFGLFGIQVGGGSASGGGSVGGAIGDAVGGISDALGSGLDNAGGGAGKVADELDKASGSAKELKKYLAGVDELNLTPEKSQPSGGSGSGGSGGSGGAGAGAGLGGLGDTVGGVATETENAADKVKDEIGEVADWIVKLVDNLKSVWNALKTGFLSVSDYINTSIANLKQAFINLGNSIQDFLLGAWQNGGEQLVYNFGRLGGAITGAIIDIAGQCVQMASDLFEWLNPDTNPYTRMFIAGLNNLLVACQNFALSVGGWFKTFVDNGGQAFLNVMGDILMILGTTLANILANVINWVTLFMNSWAGQLLIEGVALALNLVAGAIKAVMVVIEKLTPLWSALLLAFGLKSGISTAITLFGKLGSKLVDFGLTIAANIESVVVWGKNIVLAAKDAIKNFGSKLKDGYKHLKDFAKNLKDNIKKVVEWNKSHTKNWDDVKKGWKNFVTNIKDRIKAIGTHLKDGITKLKNWCKDWKTHLNTLKATISTKLTNIKTAFTNNWSAIKTWGANTVKMVVDTVKKAVSSFTAWITSLTWADVQTGLLTAGTWLLNGALAVLTSPITWIIAAIAALIAIIKKVGDHFNWWTKIMDWLKEKCGWLYDSIMKVWEGAKSFFGWKAEENGIEDETNDAGDALNGLGDTMEEVSDRFGTATSAINESLSSIGIDSNKLALQLDEAEAMFNEKFGMISANAKEYLDAVTSGNEDMLSQMAGDADKYLAEIQSAFNDMSVAEQAVFYATYGEINGVTDGWLDYTKGSYEEALIKHTGMLESIRNNENLTYDEKLKRIDEEKEAFKTAQDEKLATLNTTIAEMENAEWQSEEDKYMAIQPYYEKRNKLIQDMEDYQLGSIDTVDEAVQTSAQTQEDAYNNVGNSQEQALEGVDTALENTKTNLGTFKEESDKVAKEIPEAWTGIGETISEEFDEASNEVVKSLNTMNTKVKGQSNTLKDTLKSAFATINDGTKKSMTTMTNNIKQAFDKMSKNIKTQMQQIATELQARFTQINNGLNKSFTTMSTQVITVLKNMANQISNSLRGVETTFKTSMNNISNVAKTKIQEACKTITSKVEAMKQPITNSFNGIKTNVGNSLDALNKTVTNKMQVVLNTVKRFANQLQNATNFTFKTPYMKMPHINVHGDWNFEKKTTPSFSVRWYSDGGIFNQRSLIGVGDKYHGIGNASEAVVPLDSMYKNIRNIVKEENKANTGDTRPVTITLNVDGKELARSTVSSMKDLARVNALDMSWL